MDFNVLTNQMTELDVLSYQFLSHGAHNLSTFIFQAAFHKGQQLVWLKLLKRRIRQHSESSSNDHSGLKFSSQQIIHMTFASPPYSHHSDSYGLGAFNPALYRYIDR